MKRILSICMLLMLLVALAGCSEKQPGQTTPATQAGSTQEVSGGDELPALTEGMFEGPIAMTSVGQSADVNVVETLFKKAGLEVYMNATMSGDSLTNHKTLVLAVGGSSKGLGAAGIDENQELERVTALIAAAKAKDMKIVALHIGGSARRGTLSDKFIPDSMGAADAAIIVSEGDGDNMMRGILKSNQTPAAYIKTQIEAIDYIKLIFK